jgi:hypothetical protein
MFAVISIMPAKDLHLNLASGRRLVQASYELKELAINGCTSQQ